MKNSNQIAQIALTSVVAMALSASPALAGYGSTPSNTTGTPACNDEAPAKPTFSYVRKSGASEIEIGWNAADRATRWTVAYGNESGKYIYGSADFGDSASRSINISMLPKGVYYVVVKASNGCKPGPFSDERKVTVTADGSVLGTKTFRPFSGLVLGTKVTSSPTPAPSATPEETVSSPTPSASGTPATSESQLNWFQKLIKYVFGV
ncbi:MAG: hypothetical protein WCL07_00855 [bacterium]